MNLEVQLSCTCSCCRSMHCLYGIDVLIILPHLNWSHPWPRQWPRGWPSNPRMYKAFRSKNRRCWFLADSKYHFVTTILISSDNILMWDQLSWKTYILSFPMMSRMSQMGSVCGLGVHFCEDHPAVRIGFMNKLDFNSPWVWNSIIDWAFAI
jgi:hypothetical protein